MPMECDTYRDDTADLDFSLFQSHKDILYDTLGDLSFEDDDIVIELEEQFIAQLAREGCR